MDKNPAMLEKRALLEETDSEEDEDAAYAKSKYIVSRYRYRYGHMISR